MRFNSRWEIGCAIVFALGFVPIAALFVWQPLGDPDFWWHLKTGELIVESRGLLDRDPFNFTSGSQSASLWERFVLNAYWLWQITAYGFYRAGGLFGIKLMSSLTLVLTYAVLAWSMIRQRVRPTVALPLLGISLFVYSNIYNLERPQIISFLCAALVIAFFVEIRAGGRPTPWLYPLMLVWANMHGGVVVGPALLILFAVGSVWDFREDRQRRRDVVRWCGGGVLMSLVSPNGWNAYLVAGKMMSAGGEVTVQEFTSPFASGALAQAPLISGAFVLLLLAHFVPLGVLWRRGAVADWLVSAFIVTLTFMYIRNLAFLPVALVPMTAYYLAKATERSNELAENLVALAVVCGLALFGMNKVVESKWWRAGIPPEISSEFPLALPQFLSGVPLRGNIFNEYGWGGFLAWQLYPQYKFFIDGRGIDAQATQDYRKIAKAEPDKSGGRPEYKILLDKYQINVIVMGIDFGYAGINSLLKFLLNDPAWQPIYHDRQSFILVKDNGENAAVLKKYSIDKVVFLNQLRLNYDEQLRRNPGAPQGYLARGDLLGFIGRYDEAARDFALVKQLEPANPFLSGKLRQLEELRDQARVQP